jgi:succinate-semialdehyde dehydrogenase/glutarate-semialdehyde dehydrogenase
MESKFNSVNPCNNKEYATYDFENWGEVKNKIDLAAQAFAQWRKTSFEDRKTIFLKIADLLEAREQTYAQIISEEMGKPISQSKAEVTKSALVCRYYAENAASFLADQRIDAEKETIISREPLGVILQIMPWNFPFWQVFRFSAPALMAGNVSLLKHAPNVPRAALAIEGLFLEAGMPKGVLQNIFASVEDVENIMKDTAVQGVALTGSARAGSAVGRIAGKNIKRSVLELGGSDAFIVLEDADLEEAVKVGVQSRFGNNGQTCIAAKRFIVHEKVAAQFLAQFKKAVSELKFGDPMDENIQLTTMARVDLAEELQKQVDASVAAGAVVELDGGQVDNSAVFKPMILSNIKKGMPAYEEELFGPVASFFVVNSVAEAIELANDTIFGLGAAVWTKDEQKALNIARQLEAGTVAINQLVRSAPSTPFGGIKQSGIGRELGVEGIMEFINLKSIVIA